MNYSIHYLLCETIFCQSLATSTVLGCTIHAWLNWLCILLLLLGYYCSILLLLLWYKTGPYCNKGDKKHCRIVDHGGGIRGRRWWGQGMSICGHCCHCCCCHHCCCCGGYWCCSSCSSRGGIMMIWLPIIVVISCAMAGESASFCCEAFSQTGKWRLLRSLMLKKLSFTLHWTVFGATGCTLSWHLPFVCLVLSQSVWQLSGALPKDQFAPSVTSQCPKGCPIQAQRTMQLIPKLSHFSSLVLPLGAPLMHFGAILVTTLGGGWALKGFLHFAAWQWGLCAMWWEGAGLSKILWIGGPNLSKKNPIFLKVFAEKFLSPAGYWLNGLCAACSLSIHPQWVRKKSVQSWRCARTPQNSVQLQNSPNSVQWPHIASHVVSHICRPTMCQQTKHWHHQAPSWKSLIFSFQSDTSSL